MNQPQEPSLLSAACTICAPRRVQNTRRHWLLDTIYGRELLKEKLRQSRPDLVVPLWRERSELDSLLDRMIDDLDIRGWKKPSTLGERWRYLVQALVLTAEVRSARDTDDAQRENLE